jgi:hypothetical protein
MQNGEGGLASAVNGSDIAPASLAFKFFTDDYRVYQDAVGVIRRGCGLCRGLCNARILGFVRNLFEREFLGRKSIQHQLFESLARARAGEPSAFCNRRLDRMREHHELDVCSRLGLGHRHKNVEAWVRNTVRQPNSFWLQTSSDKFYPDFVVLLTDGRVAVVEYKGADRWKDADQDRVIGELWADRSNGRCVFVMLTNQEFGAFDRAIASNAS